MSGIGVGGFILIVVLALILFGPKKLPELGRAVGVTLREFKQATRGLTKDDDDDEKEPAVAKAAVTEKEKDKENVDRAQLEKEIRERLERERLEAEVKAKMEQERLQAKTEESKG